jgi:hypothetical protein
MGREAEMDRGAAGGGRSIAKLGPLSGALFGGRVEEF